MVARSQFVIALVFALFRQRGSVVRVLDLYAGIPG